MGYRSDVAIKVYGEVENMTNFKKAYDDGYSALSDDDKADVDGLIKSCDKFEFTTDTFTLAVYQYKWYDEYPEVAFINSLTQLVDKLDVNVEFISIGEDSSDVEEYYNGENVEYRLGITRTIHGLDD
jgi:hypothetical protein